MNKKVAAIVLSLLMLAFRTIHGQNADCQKQCEDRKAQCTIHCQVMGADNTG